MATNPVRGVWTWGQVDQVFPSDKDGKVRQALVRYEDGLSRSVREKKGKQLEGSRSKTVVKSVRDLVVPLEA